MSIVALVGEAVAWYNGQWVLALVIFAAYMGWLALVAVSKVETPSSPAPEYKPPHPTVAVRVPLSRPADTIPDLNSLLGGRGKPQ